MSTPSKNRPPAGADAPTPAGSPPGERLQKVLANAGVASRRTCEEWIEQGRVRVNGEVVTQLGVKVDPAHDVVVCDGRRVRPPERRYYIAVNKPRNVVCSLSDSHAARLVTDLVELSSKPMLRPVGRLDADTDGLIFLTDDGDFLYKLTHPKHHVPKTYRAYVRGVPDAAALEKLKRGVYLEDGLTAPAQSVVVRRVGRPQPPERLRRPPPPARPERPDRRGPRLEGDAPAAEPKPDLPQPHAEVELTIFEGRNRQVRRMLAAVGHPVERLTRVQIGDVRLSGLPAGAWRHLTPKEIAALTAEPKPTTTPQEKPNAWQTAPSPSRPPKAPSSPNSPRPTRPSPPRTSSNSPKRGSTTG